ncbi:MAG: hypothetical protein J6Y37_11575 [Paludibacteraceae bacterium]|nr:hypothetical protein [Paludibacteraceae bacterium]
MAGDISCAEWKWSEGDDYNGVEDPGDLLPPFAAEVIADGLYRYYLA